MSELETKIEAATEDFSDELSDEALDRRHGTYLCVHATGDIPPYVCFLLPDAER